MNQSKAQQALALLEDPPDKAARPSFGLSLRLPGETADRLIALYDLGSTEFPPTPVDADHPRKPHISRNALIVALIEAGLEAVEAAALNKSKGKKHA